MIEDSKTKDSIRNVKYSTISFFIASILSFISRTIFIKMLNQDILGLNGLFSNILGILSFSELGIGSVMNFILYKPIKEKNERLINAFLFFYGKVYRIIGCIIIFSGVLLMPFMSMIIKDSSISYSLIRLYFILYVLNSGCSYFFSFKRSLLICNNQEYILFFLSTIFNIIVFFLQTFGLVVTRNYTIYLLISLVFTFIQNILISRMIDRMYPSMMQKTEYKLSKNELHYIWTNVVSMIRHKISYILVFYTDNILINSFSGLASVGIYSNYALLVNMLNSVASHLFDPLAPSAGMLSLSKDKKHIEEVFYNILFVNFCIYLVTTVCLFCLIQMFIRLWIGPDYLLNIVTVFIILFNYYIVGMRKTVLLFWQAAGIFKYDVYKPIIECVVNLIFSILFGYYFGIAGVLLGTMISTLFVCFWWEAYLLFKHLFEKKVFYYLWQQLKYFVVLFVVGLLCSFMCSYLSNSWLSFFVGGFLCVFVCCMCIVLFFYKTVPFQFVVQIVKNELLNNCFIKQFINRN